jgi:hypothetical protein
MASRAVGVTENEIDKTTGDIIDRSHHPIITTKFISRGVNEQTIGHFARVNPEIKRQKALTQLDSLVES